MFSSAILDVAIGLAFSFLAVSLLSSAATEALSSILTWRSKTLRKGIGQLVNDPNFTGLAKLLYEHAAINPLSIISSPAAPAKSAGIPASTYGEFGQSPAGTYGKAADSARDPAYIAPRQFASALMDLTRLVEIVAAHPADMTAVVRDLGAVLSSDVTQNAQLGRFLAGVVQRSNGDIGRIHAEISAWFDNAMDRLSGVYKRQAQLVSLIIALAVACGLNIDSVRIARVVWEQPTLAEHLKLPTDVAKSLATVKGGQAPSLAGTAEQASGPSAVSAQEVLTVMNTYLPVGWNGVAWSWQDPVTWLPMLPGWLLTAFATLFGAPFWFDTLQTIVRLKGSGPSPTEKKTGRAAAA